MFIGAYLKNSKGFEFVAKAMRILKDEGRRLHLTLIGNPDDLEDDDKRWAASVVEEEGIGDLIEWRTVSSEKELEEQYRKSLFSLVTYTNYSGSFPVVMSMANGCPAIVSSEFGIAEYLKDAGSVVDPTSVEAICHAIRTYYDQPKFREDVSMRASEIARTHYNWDLIAEQTLEVYGHPC